MDLRNIAIIAHVDHGKTTLVDELLKQSGAFRENQAVAERAMDSNDLTSKALALGLRPIVVLNKVDKPDAEPDRALDECFDLFASLDADDDQLDFPHMYASGRNGWADAELNGPRKDLSALFELIVNHVPKPRQIAHQAEDFRMLATTLGSDPFVGRILYERSREQRGHQDRRNTRRRGV